MVKHDDPAFDAAFNREGFCINPDTKEKNWSPGGISLVTNIKPRTVRYIIEKNNIEPAIVTKAAKGYDQAAINTIVEKFKERVLESMKDVAVNPHNDEAYRILGEGVDQLIPPEQKAALKLKNKTVPLSELITGLVARGAKLKPDEDAVAGVLAVPLPRKTFEQTVFERLGENDLKWAKFYEEFGDMKEKQKDIDAKLGRIEHSVVGMWDSLLGRGERLEDGLIPLTKKLIALIKTERDALDQRMRRILKEGHMAGGTLDWIEGQDEDKE